MPALDTTNPVRRSSSQRVPRPAAAFADSAGRSRAQVDSSELAAGRSSTAVVVDDDRTILHLIRETLAARNIRVVTAGSAADALTVIDACAPDVVLLDIMLPDASGLQVFQQIQERDQKLPVIFVTSVGGAAMAIEAMQAGAFDYLPKPLDLQKLTTLVEQAIDTRRLMQIPVAVETADPNAPTGDLFIGRSSEMVEVFKSIGRVAGQDVTVLIRGESGTGKELVARAIYQHSSRSDKQFIAVNCAALPDSLLESELFGHEKGSFTGADRRRVGKFEQCDGGTIFLDEVGDMSPLLQSKVLRLLQEQRFERVGGNETIETNVRIIAATNRDLESMVQDDAFRSDLYYRLNGVTIALPPLRNRGVDIPYLLEFYLSQACQRLDKTNIEGISPQALQLLNAYPWPGNVRELQSVVNQMVLNTTGPVIVPDFLPAEVRQNSSNSEPQSSDGLPPIDLKPFIETQLASGSETIYADALEIMEKYVITRVLSETSGNQSKAAKRLGITRGKLRDRIVSYNISVDRVVGLQESGGRKPSTVKT